MEFYLKDSMVLPFVAFSCFVVVIKIFLLLPLLYHLNFPLDEVPGPRLAKWSRLWLVKAYISSSTDEILTAANKQYGQIIRIGPKQVLLSNPDTIRDVLKTGTKFMRGPWFDTFQLSPGHMSIVAERDPQRHKAMRYSLSSSMNSQATAKMEKTIDRNVKEWIHLLSTKHISEDPNHQSLDLSMSIKYLTLDTVVEAAIGKPFNFTQKNRDPFNFLGEIEIGMMLQQFLSVFVELNGLKIWIAKFPKICKAVFPHRSHKKGIGSFMGALHDAINENQYAAHGENIHPARMVDSWFERGVSQEDAIYELVGLIGAGVIPSANAALGIILGVVSSPIVYMKLQREIDETVAGRKISPLPIEDSVARKLPFLQACILEGIRKYAPIFFLLDREVPSGGEYLNGYYLPGGTLVSLNMKAAQLDCLYGEDPENYRPERWIIEDRERYKKMLRSVNIMFGNGATKCLGIHFAYMELNKIIFELFRNFNISVVDPAQPWKRVYHGIYNISKFNVRLEKRV